MIFHAQTIDAPVTSSYWLWPGLLYGFLGFVLLFLLAGFVLYYWGSGPNGVLESPPREEPPPTLPVESAEPHERQTGN
jgi:hypothetical protein